MNKFARRLLALAVALAVISPNLTLAAPHYPKKDHPVLRQKKAERKANKKARAMQAKTGLFGHLHG